MIYWSFLGIFDHRSRKVEQSLWVVVWVLEGLGLGGLGLGAGVEKWLGWDGPWPWVPWPWGWVPWPWPWVPWPCVMCGGWVGICQNN